MIRFINVLHFQRTPIDIEFLCVSPFAVLRRALIRQPMSADAKTKKPVPLKKINRGRLSEILTATAEVFFLCSP